MRFITLTIFILLSLLVKTALASCSINTPTKTVPMPLQLSTMTAGAEIPNGTQLYYQTYNLDLTVDGVQSTCTGSGAFNAHYLLTNTGIGLASWNGIYAGKVYKTSVPGIGVYIHQGTNGSQALPMRKTLYPGSANALGSCTGTSCRAFKGFDRWDIALIKIGTIYPGIIRGSQLPCVQVYYTNESPSPASMVENVCFTGNINVLSATCVTPDVNVNLGRHEATVFNKKGSTTSWVDSSIKLTGCPTFRGYDSKGSWYADGSGTNTAGTLQNNALELRFTPTTEVIDSAKGVVAVTKSSSSATGVGIQIGDKNTPLDLRISKRYVQGLGATGNVTLPLVARYIQTGDTVTPGAANGTITFTINYY